MAAGVDLRCVPLVRALEASFSMLRWLTSMMGRCCFTYPDTRCPAAAVSKSAQHKLKTKQALSINL